MSLQSQKSNLYGSDNNKTLEENSLTLLLSNLVQEDFDVPDFKIGQLLNGNTPSINSNMSLRHGLHYVYPADITIGPDRNDDKDHSNYNKNNKVTPTRKSQSYVYPAPCHSPHCQYVQESTSTLLAARSLAKAGYVKHAWKALESLFAVQGSNGFLPKYRYAAPINTSLHRTNDPRKYFVQKDPNEFQQYQGDDIYQHKKHVQNDVTTDYYYPGTDIPTSFLFGKTAPVYQPPPESIPQLLGLTSSGRISAPPFHATIILDLFYLSNQTESDVQFLADFSTKLYNWHYYLHVAVMRGCPLDKSIVYKNDNRKKRKSNVKTEISKDSSNIAMNEISKMEATTSSFITSTKALSSSTSPPCYNIIHPWESMVDPFSPLWDSAYKKLNLDSTIQQKNWTVPWTIPTKVKQSPNYPGADSYNKTLFLLDCISSSMKDNDHSPNNSSKNDLWRSTFNFENNILQKCPFAMLDIGYASALSQADESLLEIHQILMDKKYPILVSQTQKNEMLQWLNQSQTLLESLWNHEHQSFLSNLIVRKNADINSTLDSSLDNNASVVRERYRKKNGSSRRWKNDTDSSVNEYSVHPLPIPVVDNFMILYGIKLLDKERTQAVSYHMLQTLGNFSFNCGEYPLSSVGGCKQESVLNRNGNSHASISPLYNHWIANGLHHNDNAGLAFYLQKSTLNLICNLPNVDRFNSTSSCIGMNDFADSYNAETYLPNLSFDLDVCSKSSTLTAAVVYNILIPDKPFTYEAAPPISNSWVLALITIELFIALSIGVGCIVLSLNLIRRLKADNEADAFVRLMKYESVDMSDIYGEDIFDDGSTGSLVSDRVSFLSN